MGRHRRTRRYRETVSVANAVNAVLHRYELADGDSLRQLIAAWPDLVGVANAKSTWPGAIEDGVLLIQVANSALMHELSFLREPILNKVNQHLGTGEIVQIRLQLGRRRPTEKSANRSAMEAQTSGSGPRLMGTRMAGKKAEPPISLERMAEIVAETEGIDDVELRAIVIQARCRINR